MVAAGGVVAGTSPVNVEKNRYSNMCPYDARRVVLQRPSAAPDETGLPPALAPALAPGPESAPVVATTAPASYKCVKKSQARAGFDMGSDKAAVIAVGTVIDVIEAKPNDAGQLRIHFSGGWVSAVAGNGAVCFEAVCTELGPPPSGPAPVPEPAAGGSTGQGDIAGSDHTALPKTTDAPEPATPSLTCYINASHIELPGLRAVASQAPMHPEWAGPDTTGDFWSAVWEQQGCAVIVALAKVKRGFSGSSRYWPKEPGETIAVTGTPALSITLLSEEPAAGFTRFSRRELRLSHSDGTSREITHLQSERWPNFGVPDDPDDIAALLRTVESLTSDQLARDDDSGGGGGGAPAVWVHCSGGIGRTGVFLAALSVYRSIFPTVPAGSPPKIVPMADADAVAEAVFDAVASLRSQRHPCKPNPPPSDNIRCSSAARCLALLHVIVRSWGQVAQVARYGG